MNIREVLLEAPSRKQTDGIAAYVGGDAGRFAELMELFLGPVYRITQGAARPVSVCVEQHPKLVKPYFQRLVELLEDDEILVAVRRNVVRLFQFVEIPKRYEGRVFDACYNLLNDPDQPIAVRVFSMTVAVKLAQDEPELLCELKLVATKYPTLMTPGFRSRFRRLFGERIK